MLRDDAPSAGSEAGFGSIEPRLVVQGGVGLSRDHAGRARIAFARVGKGLLMVATDSFCYSHHVLGSLLERSRPSPTVRDVYSEVYALLGNLISHSPDTTRVSEDLKF
ncbi:MAG: hypothetical protein PVH52_03270 [bacterium]|jgi:hypothetical protein